MPKNTITDEKLFGSFFMGGFECTYAKVEHNRRIDCIAESKHDLMCREDYKLLAQEGITTVREGLSWWQIDRGNNVYDFTRFETMMRIAQEEGVQQIWDLNHYDYPEYIDPFSDDFVKAFAEYARRAIGIIRKYQTGTIYIVPINEISFWCHMGASIGVWNPYQITKGYIFKKQLVKASIAAMNAIWEEDKDVRFIQVDPIFYRKIKPPVTIVKQATEDSFKEIKFQAWDMLAGRMEPDLGGNPKYLDIIGGNYYIYNQEWITGDDPLDESCHEMIPWNSKGRISLADILQEVYDRYQRPIVLTETGSWGDTRVHWWKRSLKEMDEALERGLPIKGICAYPIVDRRDWSEGHLTNSGFWDFKPNDPSCKRVPYRPVLDVVRPHIRKWREYNQALAPELIESMTIKTTALR